MKITWAAWPGSRLRGRPAILNEAQLAEDLRYRMTTGEPRVLPMSAALLHVFNHGTHHRGQITAAISMLGYEYPALDLPYLLFSERSGI